MRATLRRGLLLCSLLGGAAAGHALAARGGEDDSLPDRMVAYFSRDLRQLDDHVTRLKQELTELPVPPRNQLTGRLGYQGRIDSKDPLRWVQLDLGKVEEFDSVVLVPMDVGWLDWPGPGYGFPVQFKLETAWNADFSDRDVMAEYIDKDFPNPGSYPVVIETPGVRARYVRIVATKLWSRTDKKGVAIGQKRFALGEIMVLRNGLNLSAGIAPERVTASDSQEDPITYSKANLVDGQSVLGPPISGEGGPNGWQSDPSDRRDIPAWVQIDLLTPQPIQEIRLYPVRPYDNPELRGFGFPQRVKVEIADDAKFTDPSLIGEWTLTANPYENPISIRGNDAVGRHLRVTGISLPRIGKGFSMALAEVEVYSGDVNVAHGKPVKASSTRDRNQYELKALVDGMTSQGRIVDWQTWLRGLERRQNAEVELQEAIRRRDEMSTQVVGTTVRSAAYVLGALVLFGILISLRSNVKKRRALEALRTRIARDLHDEIGSGLGTVSLLSQMAQDSEPDEARQDLVEIHKISVGLAEAMRDIVWFNRTDVDTVRDLLMRMRETAETMLAHQEVQFETVGEEFVKPISMERRREVFLIFKEALHNILKHAQATTVNIRAGLEGGHFVLMIRDDGKGFDAEKRSSGAGMGSMKKRAESLRSEIKIETTPGSGTTLSLAAKLH
ncbi:MAG: hypothetical protein KA004_09555 [Verrucomicrobiales bacterium]|nr:hypothetical protein [Verrucomicrobiales bacterium]